MPEAREKRIIETFVTLSDTLVDSYDVVDLLTTLAERCVEFVDATGGGILLDNGKGALTLAASSGQRSELIEAVQSANDEGPCVESFHSGHSVSIPDIRGIAEQWPSFAAKADALGFRSVHAIPMRLRERTIGSLNLFRENTGELNRRDADIARAFTDVATISILQHRAIEEHATVRNQLQNALESRVVIEQAKGVIAHAQTISPEAAFEQIRKRARNSGTPLSELAGRIVAEAHRPQRG